ncbi:MAG: Hsp20/alpha crystallin family protein [Candidatus Kuenenia sp.]|nr:Hsp20/alpha crystallin family protein [Candidatus Kuenenia hertensis]
MISNSNNTYYKTDTKQNKIEQILNEFFSFTTKEHSFDASSPWKPPTDIYETPDEIIVKMAIPGTKPQNVQVSFSKDTLTISGYRTDNSPHKKICFYQVEIRYGYFERNFYIPKPVDTNNIKASYTDGFLHIVLPKIQQKSSEEFTIKINF